MAIRYFKGGKFLIREEINNEGIYQTIIQDDGIESLLEQNKELQSKLDKIKEYYDYWLSDDRTSYLAMERLMVCKDIKEIIESESE
jgi:hypothetical protein